MEEAASRAPERVAAGSALVDDFELDDGAIISSLGKLRDAHVVDDARLERGGGRAASDGLQETGPRMPRRCGLMREWER